jgi:hypothetical protein
MEQASAVIAPNLEFERSETGSLSAPLSQFNINYGQDSVPGPQASNKASRVTWKGSAEADGRFYELGLLLQCHMQEWAGGKEKTCKKFVELLKKGTLFKDMELKLTTISDKCNDLVKLAQSHRANEDVGKNYSSGEWATLLNGIMTAYDQAELPKKNTSKKAAANEKAKAQHPNMVDLAVMPECDRAARASSAIMLCYALESSVLFHAHLHVKRTSIHECARNANFVSFVCSGRLHS